MTISSGEAPIWDDQPETSARRAVPSLASRLHTDESPFGPTLATSTDQPEAPAVLGREVPVAAPPAEPSDPLPQLGEPDPDPAVDSGATLLTNRRTSADAVLDQVDVADALGREILAAHLVGLVSQIVRAQAAGTAVVHVDGRWGAGKSTLVDLVRRRLGGAPSGADVAHLHDPLMIYYDAWRESRIAPEWWSLATAINRAVRAERALAARCLMTIVGVLQRLIRSLSVLVAGILLAAALASMAVGLWENAETLGKVITSLTAVAAIGLATGRVLFWTSPAFGRLQARTDDNPLGHIAAVVGSFRRWSPRRTGPQRIADTALAVWLCLTATWAVGVLSRPGLDHSATAALARWVADRPGVLVVAAISALLVFGIAGRGAPESVAAGPTGRRDGGPARVLSRWSGSTWIKAAAAVTTALSASLLVTTPAPGWLGSWVNRHPATAVIGGILLGILLHAGWTRSTITSGRRPMVLIVDDLDRCPADRVVKLLETIHTLLREPAAPSLLTAWRAPAPLVVLVLADARWVRAAFEEVYKPFVGLGSDVHTLGADFVQKVFDHTVLVPALSAAQVRDYVTMVTGTSSTPASDDRARSATAKEQALRAVDSVDPGDLRTPGAEAMVGDVNLLPKDRLEVEVARAAREASPTATAVRAEHLLAAYATLMPANPRLVKRVANTMAMLFALKSHLGHDEVEDVIARAAILYVRFPRLVDAMLSAPSPPPPDPPPPPMVVAGPGPAPDLTGAPLAETWARADVRAVLGEVPIPSLARCFGREYPDQAAA